MEASKAKDSQFNSCDCDMFTRPKQLRNVFTRCSDCVTNSVLLTYAEVDKECVRINPRIFENFLKIANVSPTTVL